MRNNELKVTEEFKNLFNNELVIYKNILIKGRHMILFFCERHESCALFQNIIFLNIYNEGRKGSVGRILS